MAHLSQPFSAIAAARPRHATQPEGKLVPATVEIDEEGNPIFFYPEATPQKISPRIVTPRAILNRLSMKRGGPAAHMHIVPTKQNGGGDVIVNHSSGHNVVSLHHSMMMDEQSLTACDENDDNHSVQSSQSHKSVQSSQSHKSKGSRSSLSKLRLRLSRKKKNDKYKVVEEDPQAIAVPLQQKQQPSHDGSRMIPGLSRWSSHDTESTRSLTSRASSVGGLLLAESEEASFMTTENPMFLAPMACDPNSSFLTAPTTMIERSSVGSRRSSNLEIKTTGLHDEESVSSEATPPPVATLKAAMEKAEMEKNGAVYSSIISRRLSTPMLLMQKPKNKNLVAAVKSSAHAAAAVRPSSTVSVASSHPKQAISRPSSTKSSASSVTSISSTSSNHPQNKDFKVFLLLLHPTSKIFELIQLFFNPTTTTIRDVLYMIPTNATEPALGAQDYTGLCRPKTEEGEDEEIANLDLLVQNHSNMKLSAQVVRGEVLVAIPLGYKARKIVTLSQQILVNPRICKLLEGGHDDTDESDSKKKKKRSKDSRKKTTSSRSRRHSSGVSRSKSVEFSEQRDDQEQSLCNSYSFDTEADASMLSVQRAMKKAASAAAAANAAVNELQLPRHTGTSLVTAAGKTYRYPHGRRVCASGRVPNSPADTAGTDESMSLESALKSLDTSTVVTKSDYSRTDASENENSTLRSYDSKLDTSTCSYSWSRSLDNSFAARRLDTPLASALLANHSMNMSFMSCSSTAQRRRNKNRRLIRRIAVGVIICMSATYFADSNGFASRHGRVEGMLQQPLRLTGFIQCIGIFLVLFKIQLERVERVRRRKSRGNNRSVSSRRASASKHVSFSFGY